MFRRFSTFQLSIALAALVLFYFVAWIVDRPSDSSFEKNLATIDTAKVDKILVYRPDKDSPVEIVKSNELWQVGEVGGAHFNASEGLIETAFNTLENLTANQLVSKRQDAWGTYDVSDSAGVRVEVYEGTKKVADVTLGKSQYQPSGMMTYVRPTEADEVYLVDGFINSNFNKEVNEWRDKSLLKGPNSQWTAMSFDYPADSSFRMMRGTNNRWILPDSVELDVTKVNRYLNRITNLKGQTFVDAPGNTAQMKLTLNTIEGPIEIKAFPANDSTYVVNSTLNPEAYFEGDNIWDKVFVGLGSLLPDPDTE